MENDKNYTNLTDEQLIEFAKLRLENDKFDATVKKIKIENKTLHIVSDEFIVSFLIKTKEFKEQRYAIVFKKFYPNEFKFLTECGIEF